MIQLNESALKHAHKLINENLIIHEKGEWEHDKPTLGDEDKFLAHHTWLEYGHWFLGIDTDKSIESKERYHFPYAADFKLVDQGGLIAIAKKAEEHGYDDIKDAAQDLFHIIEKKHK